MEPTYAIPYTISSIGYSKEADILTNEPRKLQRHKENEYADISPIPKDMKDAANTHETSIEPYKSKKDEPGNTNVKTISIGQKRPKQNQMNIWSNESSSKSIYIIYLSLFVIVILFAIFAYIIAKQERKMTSLLNEKLGDAAQNVRNMTGILDKKLDDSVENIKLNLSQESFERLTQINLEAQARIIEDDALAGRVQNAQKTADNASNRISNAELKINSQQSQLYKAVETSGWYKATDNRYYKHFPRAVNYDKAADLCQYMGAKLAASGIRNHRTEIVNFVLAPRATIVWIGLDDRHAEGQWVWSDGVLATNNVPWGVGEPNNNNNEDCGAIYFAYKWKINDVFCTDGHSFVCEKVI